MRWRVALYLVTAVYLLAIANAPGGGSWLCWIGAAANAACAVMEICRARALSEPLP